MHDGDYQLVYNFQYLLTILLGSLQMSNFHKQNSSLQRSSQCYRTTLTLLKRSTMWLLYLPQLHITNTQKLILKTQIQKLIVLPARTSTNVFCDTNKTTQLLVAKVVWSCFFRGHAKNGRSLGDQKNYRSEKKVVTTMRTH